MSLIDQVNAELSLLREYRTRQIADVVTGKVDVREAAAQLPEETEEPEGHDDTDNNTNAQDQPEDEVECQFEELHV
jgi:type I restriction enzyme S subunit